MSIEEYDKTWLIVKKPDADNTAAIQAANVPSIDVQDADAPTQPKASDAKQDSLTVSQQPTVNNGIALPDGGQDDDDDDPDPLEDETIIKIMDVTQMESASGQTVVTKTRRFKKPKNKKDRFRDYAGVLRRSLDEKGNLISVKLEVKSPFLKRAMKEILKAEQRINLDAETIIISMPYESLFYNRHAVKAYRATLTEPSEMEQMDLLIEFIETNLESTMQEYDRNIPNGKVTRSIAWTLFPPGEIIVMNANSNTPAQCFVVKDCQRLPNGMLNIKCSCFAYNGNSFGKTAKSIAFPLPITSGSMPITSLFAFPLKHHPRYQDMEEALVKRGHRYAKIVKRAHMNYNGTALTRDPLDMEMVQVHLNERVMVDYAEFVRQNSDFAIQLETDPGVDIAEDVEYEKCWCSDPDCKKGGVKKSPVENSGKSVKGNDDERTAGTHDISITDEEAILCPGSVFGFALADKCWAELRIDNLQEIHWNDAAYSRLEMDAEYKQVIRALVEAHRKHSKPDSEEFDDIIAGKGLGLVFLLQGDPGLGKTLTAESVAEQAHKPLYAVTSGELGTTVNDMEAALKKAFRIAKGWNAILLLDEADVFLSKRSVDNLEKNAFVSVFLRLMEYYQGILFLTTNRAEDFDPAFMSRIHLILDYKPLPAERRANIWRNLSARMNKDETLGQAGMEALGREYDINGREIKNLLRTAWCLAKENSRALTLEDIHTVARISARYRGNEVAK
ncbi:hypothetical protein PRZ48_002536 [Zasmidium cellare]|uniref:AAA+ ATPase domain-containing protein n=1 Tax=Zasmidium cellare TaxID=395010 RepID=A0ABR0F4B5_ZASCE|nr:hypothetical protein PRZ48_002536 [Zasmidium cellare]